ncbi:MAG: hypothetical protein D6768_07800 [Chloroflexi bacterium]|nr:MAG: hypothetical protein D6768_07800 [Chloroflexota bacterium]
MNDSQAPASGAKFYGFSRLSTRYALHLTLFLFLLAVYLLTFTPRVNSSDGLAMFATAESLVRRGALDVEQIRWMDLQQGTYGLDGLLYSRKGVGVPLGMLPLVALGLAVPAFGPVSAGLLFNAIVTALTGVLLLVYVELLGFARRTGLLAALIFGLSTLAWPYAKSLFSDPFSGLLLLAAALALLKFRHTAHLRWAFLAGLLLGWNVATRYAEALFLPVFGLLLLYYGFTIYDLRFTTNPSQFKIHNSKFTIAILAFAAPILLTGLALMAFNLSRYGNPFNTGYLPTETFSAIWLDGIVGQLASPGRGLFLFSPVFLLSLWGFFPFLRRRPAEALLAAGIILIHLLLYGKWFMWHGGYAWGPRFLIPTLPFWALLLAPIVKKATQANTQHATRFTLYVLRFALPALVALGVLIQLPLLLVDFGDYMGWLLDTGLPLFDRQTFFNPAYSPFAAVWPFISMRNLDLAWAWHGQINGALLAALLANVVVCGAALWQAARQNRAPLAVPALLTSLAAAVLLLGHAHRLPPEPLQLAVAELNRGVTPADAVITNGPQLTPLFAERYRGRAPVLGLNAGGFPLPGDTARRLAQITTAHRQVWLLPNAIPAAESAIEQTLLREMARVRDQDFQGQRLLLFVQPPDFADAAPSGALFEQAIQLQSIAAPEQASPGTALAVELVWQAGAPVNEDLHVFIHLLNAQGQLVAQADGQPAQWQRPTSTWTPGETIVDRYGLWIPPDAAPGPARLRIGLYRPQTGERLHLPSGDDAVEHSLRIQ